MIYIEDGIEIQYRECQILRDTAKSVLSEKDKKKGLAQYKNDWMTELEHLAEVSELKRKYAVPMSVFMKELSEDMFEAVSEYAESLVKKEKGIDIMVPYISRNQYIILPVNTHEITASDFMETQGKDLVH